MANGMIAKGQGTEIAWYENVGKPGKGTEWKKHVVAAPFNNAFEVIAIDLDGDGDLDLAATAWGTPDGRVVWFENPGDPRGPWKAHELKTDWSRPNQIIAADLNGDKRPDLVVGSEDGSYELRWWRTEGKK
jgi:hypothetical protein